jgi:phage-related protein
MYDNYMRQIIFYKTKTNQCPVEDFLDNLSPKVAQKVVWVLSLVEEMPRIPKKWLKHLTGTDGIYEIRVQLGSDIYRIFCFFHEGKLVVLTHGFVKKSNKTPKGEIEKAAFYKADWLRRKS